MRFLLFIWFILVPAHFYGQNKIAGNYCDYFANRIRLNTDSSFYFDWALCLSSSWSSGKWTLVGDTIFLQMIPVFDTLTMPAQSKDSLVLSPDTIPDSISQELYSLEPTISGWQNRKPIPDKLFYKKGKLYLIQNGHLDKQKRKSFWTNTKVRSWYFKCET